ncbi:MAG TPA: ABC transporter ATP-binding protein [Ktedonobacterales bacterium]|nr:ABC transporter ATP-binding protein [Ktedonobacterales bacterium]
MTNDAVLEVKHLSVDYGSAAGAVHAVDDVSFTLRRGQIFGLAGESGSGKSTLAYAIARLLRPPAVVTKGEVWFYPRSDEASDGKAASTAPVNVLGLTPQGLRAFRWRRLSIVFQSAMNALNPVLDINTQITDVLRAHEPGMSRKARQERALELLRLVGIAPDRLHSYPHELSGGMRQRAIIAIALALNPDLIIMDEPTTALDVVVQREILAEISALRDRLGFSVIFITHDLSLLLEISDQIAIMYAGRLVETAKQRALYHQPRHPYTYGLLHSFPKLHGPRQNMTGIPGSPPDLRAVPAGCAFNPRCNYAFGACQHVQPRLMTLCPAEPEQQVACHLYDPKMGPPDLPEALSGQDALIGNAAPAPQKESAHEHSSSLF